MPVLYDGTALVPAPIITVSEQKHTLGDGTKLGVTYTITLHGTLVTEPPGGPYAVADAKLGVLLAKQKALAALFSKNGRLFEVYSPDGTNVVQCNPIVKDGVQFAEGIWVARTDYTITLESDRFYETTPEGSTDRVYEASDEWQIEELGYTTDAGSAGVKPIWKLTHTVSAKGRPIYDLTGVMDPNKTPWQQARNWVVNRLTTSNLAGRPFNTSEEMNLDAALQGYNHTRVENVGTADGSFSITETWILAYGMSATEEYTISVHKLPEEGQGSVGVTVSGTVRGLASGLNQLNTRIDNAITYFNGSVKPHLFSRVSGATPGYVLSDYGSTGTIDYNYAEGSITYSYEFSDKPSAGNANEVYDTYTVSRKSGIEVSETTVTVSGTIQGRLRVDEPNASLLKYQRAKAYWDTIFGGTALFDRANLSGVAGLKTAPVTDNVDYNIFEGTITYSFDFSNRLNDTARNDYTTQMRFSRDDGRTIVSVDGTVTGLREKDTDPYSTKYANALSFWGVFQSQIPGIVAAFVPGVVLNPTPSAKTRGDNTLNGTIQYSWEYNTDKVPDILNALREQISVSDTHPADVFAVIPVLGRKAGPILQDIGSKKEKARTLSIEAGLIIGSPQPNTDAIVASYKPVGNQVFVDRDEETWIERTASYTRNVTWIYE
jgi:hypothetical protein